ncbi:MAG TPA: hypothetical protein VG496_17950, partial [Myxococcales bacterium]|nr:hypothetical protein [Myxococcales bacterium]
PSLTLRVADRSLDVESRYAARLLAMPGDSSLALRQDGALRARWEQTRNLSWSGNARFDYGQSAFVFDPGERKPFDSMENVLPLIHDQLAAEGSAGFNYVLSRGVTATANVGYAAYGGASAPSQHFIPLQQGPQLYAAVAQDVSRVDQLTTDLYASRTTSSDSRTSFVVKGTEAWTRQLAAATRVQASLGASIDGGSGSVSSAVFPVGGAQLQHDVEARGNRIELRAAAQLGPHYSLSTADLQQRAEVAASVRWVVRDLSIRARAGAARDLADWAKAGNLFIGAVDLSVRLWTDASFRCGFEAVRQSVAPDVLAPTSAWFAFAAFNAAARNLL